MSEIARLARRIIERYLKVGGGALTGGLAYALLFSLFTILLAAAAIAGLLLSEPARRDAVVDSLSTLLPPLAPYVSAALVGLASGAVGLSVGSVVGLVLGGVRLYLSLEDAIGRLFHEQPRRSPWATARRAVAVPPLLALAFSALLLISGPIERASALVPSLFAVPVSLLAPLLIAWAALYLIYRLVPASRPSARNSALVALVAALAIGLLGRLWSLITPLLIGNVALYGPPLAVILGLVYLQLVATILLLAGSALAEIEVRSNSGSVDA
jgi:uncharacterized BrkB/YihY/UPF0761 family membrane protein